MIPGINLRGGGRVQMKLSPQTDEFPLQAFSVIKKKNYYTKLNSNSSRGFCFFHKPKIMSVCKSITADYFHHNKIT